MSNTTAISYARQEYELARKELNLERKKIILYGAGEDPSKLNADLYDLSVITLGEVLGYEADELARDVVRWQNDTIRAAGFYCDSTGRFRGKVGDDLVLAYRGGGKSTWGTITRAIWYALRWPNIRIGLVSETEDLPKAFLVEIKGHLTGNVDLIDMFQTFKPRPGEDGKIWDAKKTTFRQRTKIYIKEPTFHAFGVGGQSAGYHYDVLLPDDLVTYKGSRTKKVRQGLSDWYDSTFGGLQMRHTVNHHTGTPYFPGDLYDRLQNGRENEKRGPLADATLLIPAEYTVIEKKKIAGKVKKGGGTIEIRRANSPSRLPLDALDRIAEKIGPIHYGTQYMMDRSKMVGKIFSLAEFDWYDPDAPGLEVPWGTYREGWARYCFFDLKATSKNVGDYFVGCVAAISPDKSQVDIIDMVRERTGMSGQRRAILYLTRKHRATLAGIEAVQMQIAFAEEIQESELIPAEPVPVEGDKVARAISITPQVNKIRLPFEDSTLGQTPAFKALYEELISFPDGDYDDTVDGLVGVIKLAYYGGAPAAAGGDIPKETKDSRPGRAPRKVKLRAKY